MTKEEAQNVIIAAWIYLVWKRDTGRLRDAITPKAREFGESILLQDINATQLIRDALKVLFPEEV